MIKSYFWVFSLLIIPSYFHSQESIKIEREEQTNKCGIYKWTNDTTYEVILPLEYQSYESFSDHHQYLFYKSYKTDNKGGESYKNCVLLDSNLTISKEFDEITFFQDNKIIERSSKGMSLLDTKNNVYLLENKEKIFIPKYYHGKTYGPYYQNSEEVQKATFPKLIAVWDQNKTSIFDWNNKLLFTVDNYQKVISGIPTGKNTSTYLNYIGVGDKIKSLYSFEGKLYLKKVKQIRDVSNQSYYYKTQTPYIELTTDNGQLYLLKGSKPQIEKIDGIEFFNVTNPNKLVVKRKDGYVVYDSLGNKYNNIVYQRLLEPVKWQKWNNKQYVNLAKLNNEWFFVDSLYNPINNDRYYYASDLGTNDFKIVKSKDTKKEIYLFNCFGEQVLQEPIEFIDEFYTNDFFLTLQKNNLSGIYYDGQTKTDFIYQSIKETCAESDVVKCFKNNEYVIVDIITGTEYLTNQGVTDIKCFGDPDIWSFLAYKGDHFSIAQLSWETDTTKQIKLFGNYQYEAEDFNEDYFYNYNVVQLKKNGKWGVLSTLNFDSIIIPFEFDEKIFKNSSDFNELADAGYIKVIQTGKVGLLNLRTFKLDMPCEYDDFYFLDEYLITKKGKYYGAFTAYNLQEICPTILLKSPDYNFLSNNQPSTLKAIVHNTEVTCLMTQQGVKCFDNITLPKSDDQEIVFIQLNNKWGILNPYSGDTLIKPLYSSIKMHPNGDYFITTVNKKYGIAGYYGKVVLENKYDEIISEEYQSFDIVRIGKKWGVYSNENQVLSIEYDELLFQNDFFYAKKEGQWGAYELNGELILEHQYKTEKDLDIALSEL